MNGGINVAQVASPNDVECLKFAHLFSAAPELLAACKLVIAEANRLIANGVRIDRSAWKTINKLKAAIAKAENQKK